jgi:hypothetical protein
MKSRANKEYTAFEDLLKRVVSVPHSEIKAKLEAEKSQKEQAKTSPSSRASSDKD